MRSWFHILLDDDRPPCPAYGTRDISDAISVIHGRLQHSGRLCMHVLIGEQGAPKTATITVAPDKEVADYAAKVLLPSNMRRPGVAARHAP